MPAIRNVVALFALSLLGCHSEPGGENAAFQTSVFNSDNGQIHVAIFHWNSGGDVQYISLEHIELLNRKTSTRDSRCDASLNLSASDSDWLSSQRVEGRKWAIWDIALPADAYLIKHCKAAFTIKVELDHNSGARGPDVIISTDLIPGTHEVLRMGKFDFGRFVGRPPSAMARSTGVVFGENTHRLEILFPKSNEETIWKVEVLGLKCGSKKMKLLPSQISGPGVVLAKGQWGSLVRELKMSPISEKCEWVASLSERKASTLRHSDLQWAASIDKTFARMPVMY